MAEASQPRAASLEEFAWKFSTAAEPSGARSGIGAGSPGLDFSSSPAGRSREGAGGPRHWRENVRNVPGASTYPRRGQRKGAGRGEGRGARPRAPEKTCLFSCGRSPVGASSPPCTLPTAPRAPRPPPGPARLREPAPRARPTLRLAPRAGHLCQVGLSSRCRRGPAERQRRGTGPVPSPVTGTTPGLSFPIHNLRPLQASLLGFRLRSGAPWCLVFTVSKERL